MWNEKELMDQLELYFNSITKEQLINDLIETGSLEFMEKVSPSDLRLPLQEFNYHINGSVVPQEVNILDSFELIRSGFRLKSMLYNHGQSISLYKFTNDTNKEESIKQENIDLPIGA
jgi:hypothetical protein